MWAYYEAFFHYRGRYCCKPMLLQPKGPARHNHATPFHLSDEGLPCYTGNSFFTESDKAEPTLYDMELNYIASFCPHLELVASVKIVSDNLSVEAFLNNAIRESGVLTSDEVWENVRQAVETILSRNQDKKR